MPTWPASLEPVFDGDNYDEELPDTTERIEMETGPPYVIGRYTAGEYPITGTRLCNDTEWATLKDFYINTLARGTVTFTVTHPDTQSSITARFTAAPKRRYRGPGLWVVTLAWEVMP